MSTTSDAISGAFVLHANIEAKSNEAADEIIKLLLAIKRHTESDAEPGCLTFRINRFETFIMLYEEYADAEAAAAHIQSEPFKAYAARMGDGPDGLCAKPRERRFYKEVK